MTDQLIDEIEGYLKGDTKRHATELLKEALKLLKQWEAEKQVKKNERVSRT